MSKGKQEKAAELICEKLYKFSWGPNEINVIGELQTAWNDTLTVSKLNYDGKIKPEIIEKLYDCLLEKALQANNKIKEVYKAHQDLNKWMNNALLANNGQIKEAIYAYKTTQLQMSNKVWN